MMEFKVNDNIATFYPKKEANSIFEYYSLEEMLDLTEMNILDIVKEKLQEWYGEESCLDDDDKEMYRLYSEEMEDAVIDAALELKEEALDDMRRNWGYE